MSNLLFHYCPTQAFHSIIFNKSIWLSSLSLSNDSMEGTLATDKLLARIENETTSSAEVVRMKKAVDLIKSFSDGLGFCLTADGDKLSQWRGYADDGHGFSIGFSKKYLTDKTKSNGTSHITKFFFEQVRYENKVFQSQEIDSIFDLLKNKKHR